MDWAVAIPFAAVIISLGTLLFTGVSLRQKVSVDEVDRLRLRVTRAEEELEVCRNDRQELRLQVIALTAEVKLGRRV